MATETNPATRRTFIRLLGAAGSSILLAPRLFAGSATAQQPVAQAATAERSSVSAQAHAPQPLGKRCCPCCEA